MNRMKTIYPLSILSLLAIVLAFSSCILEKEPDIPIGATNEKTPVFLSTELVALSHDSVRANARLSTLGNLNILHYGWVWSENTNPTLKDTKLELGELGTNAFETLIPGLTLGKTYHLRPYVVTGTGETYGVDKTVYMGIPKLGDVALMADSSCFLRVQSLVQSPTTLTEYGIIFQQGTGTPTLQKKDGQIPGSGINNGNFQSDMSMLNPNTAYSVRAYAVNAAGTGYSKVMPLKTSSALLVLQADFSINTDVNIFQGAIVQFTNTSKGANAYTWSFGDGETSRQASVTHTFNTLGNMPVRLTVEKGGCMQIKDTLLKILPDPFKNYWVNIPGGTFRMGCTTEQGTDCKIDEKPAHQVTLSPFVLGKTEITQGQYVAVTGVNLSQIIDCGLDCPTSIIDYDRILIEFLPTLSRKTGRNYALPTEAQWEYAARGGLSASNMTKYAGSNNLDAVGWHTGNSSNTIHPVGLKAPNGYGLYDMSGNVSEYCRDWYEDYTSQAQINPTGPLSGPIHVSRGGSYTVTQLECRVSFRSHERMERSFGEIGFRIIRLP